MSEPTEPPMSSPAAGAGCGVLAGASVISLMFFARAQIAPVLTDLTGLNLDGSRWTATCVVLGLVTALGVGLAFVRALRIMPDA